MPFGPDPCGFVQKEDPPLMIEAILFFLNILVINAMNPCTNSLRRFMALLFKRQEYLNFLKISAEKKNDLGKTFNLALQKLTAEVRRTLKTVKNSADKTILETVYGHLQNICPISRSDLRVNPSKPIKTSKESEPREVECPVTGSTFEPGDKRIRLSLTRRGGDVFVAETPEDAFECMKAILTNPQVATVSLQNVGSAKVLPIGSWNNGDEAYGVSVTMANKLVWNTVSPVFSRMCYPPYKEGRKCMPTPFGRLVKSLITKTIHRLLLERNSVQPPPSRKFMFCHKSNCKFAVHGFLETPKLFGRKCPHGHLMCATCGLAPHQGPCQTAVDAAASAFEELDAETRTLLEADSKRCPTCLQFVTRTAGCNHMTCACGQHFCWRCGQTFSHQVQYEDHDGCTGLDVYGAPNGW